MKVGAGLGGTCCPRDASSSSHEGSRRGWATGPAPERLLRRLGTDLGFGEQGSSRPSLQTASGRTGESGGPCLGATPSL